MATSRVVVQLVSNRIINIQGPLDSVYNSLSMNETAKNGSTLFNNWNKGTQSSFSVIKECVEGAEASYSLLKFFTEYQLALLEWSPSTSFNCAFICCISRSRQTTSRKVIDESLRLISHHRSFLSPLFVYRGSATSVVMISIILHGTVDGNRRRGRSRKSWKDSIKEWTGQSMLSLLRIADDSHRSRCICRSTPTTPGCHRY